MPTSTKSKKENLSCRYRSTVTDVGRVSFLRNSSSKQFHNLPSSPRKRNTRTIVKMALTASQIALNQFIEVSDRQSEFEPMTNTPSQVPPSLSMLNIRREEIRALWDRLKAEYDECTGFMAEAGESEADSLAILRAKYKKSRL